MQNIVSAAKEKINYFNTFEKGLWCTSIFMISASFLLGNNFEILSFIASLIGVTALIFLAKGNVFGQMLIVVFSLFYGVISFRCSYYGEMVTYLGMTGPMAALATIEWLKHPFQENHAEVAVAELNKKNLILLTVSTIAVTIVFYFILAYFNTSSLPLSTLSITTSFIAVTLTYFRSDLYALAYASNDLILIVLWVLASLEDPSYLTMVICFFMFFINDLYGYYSWRKMKKRQFAKAAESTVTETMG